jgi:hypothetical protein
MLDLFANIDYQILLQYLHECDILPGRQTAFQKGLAMHFPVDMHIQSENIFKNILDIENVVTLCRERPNSISVDVLTRSKVIIQALKWLPENKKLYENLNHSRLGAFSCQDFCNVCTVDVEESGAITVSSFVKSLIHILWLDGIL